MWVGAAHRRYAQLGSLPIFHELTPSFRVDLFPLLKPISFAPNDIIFRKGAPSRAVYFLLSGEIDVYRGDALHDSSEPNPPGGSLSRRVTSRLTSTHEVDLTVTDWTGASGNPTSTMSVEGEELLIGSSLRPLTRAIKHQGIFGQAALLGRRREATLVAREQCEALVVAKEDLVSLFEKDPIHARRVCLLLLSDFLRMDRLAMLAMRFRMLACARGTPERAAVVIAYNWRRHVDQLARASDPIYELIEAAKEPLYTSVLSARSLGKSPSLGRMPTGRWSLSATQSDGAPKGVVPVAHLLPGADPLNRGIGELKEMMRELTKGHQQLVSRLQAIEDSTPRSSKAKGAKESGKGN